jgi:hypothetical protein
MHYTLLLFFFVLLIIAFLIVTKRSQSNSNNRRVDVERTPPPDLELLEHQPININFFKYIQGTIRNNTNTCYNQVEVKVSIFANKSELMGSSSACTVNLGPGEKWEFLIPVLEQGEFSYQFISIAGS